MHVVAVCRFMNALHVQLMLSNASSGLCGPVFIGCSSNQLGAETVLVFPFLKGQLKQLKRPIQAYMRTGCFRNNARR